MRKKLVINFIGEKQRIPENFLFSLYFSIQSARERSNKMSWKQKDGRNVGSN